MPVILWTDGLTFLLVALLTIALVAGFRNQQVRMQWRKVYQHPCYMISLVILIAFATIGLLDSLHFVSKAQDASPGVSSVLDILLEPISQETESSYSAPFATHLFIKDMVKDPDGEIVWQSAPLKYVTPLPITKILFPAVMQALGIWLVGGVILWLLWQKYFKSKLQFSSPIVVTWCTFGVLLLLAFCCYHLMQHYHIFGTDKIGEDIFYSSLKSIRTGLIIGILTTMLTLPFAVLFGAMAGYYGGWIDDAIQYIYTTLSSIPGVLLIAAAMLSLDALIDRNSDLFSMMAQRSDVRLLLLCIILGITSWTTLCRILRGETLKLREQGFILSARVIGLNSMQIITKHIVPNLTHIILISLIIDFSGLVLAEAVLSYVGVGVDASMYSWGNMINGARMEMGRDPVIWWTLAGAFVLMFTLVLAANIFADGVRDAFDPRAS